MKNHFFFPWTGNKRDEVDIITSSIKLENEPDITTIVEPFCGSCAMSVYISSIYPRKYKYVINDLDENLIKLIRIAKDPESWEEFKDIVTMMINIILNCDSFEAEKDMYNTFVKGGTVYGYYLSNKYYTFRSGLYPNTSIQSVKDFNCLFIDFLRNEDVTVTNDDALKCLKEYNHRENIILLDPPYIMTCNSFYNGGGSESFNIYEYLFDTYSFHASVFMIIEYTWIMKVYSLKCSAKAITYDKKYKGIRKRNATHAIICFDKIVEKDDMLSITIPIKLLSTNQLYKTNRGRIYLTKSGRDFKEAVRTAATEQYSGQPTLNKMSVKVWLSFADNRRHDVDNIKALLDALEGIIYVNDSQIFELYVTKKLGCEDSIKVLFENYVE